MNKKIVSITAVFLAVLFMSMPADASWIPDRRKNQFSTEFAYAVFPYPYSLPGIGTGLSLVGGAMNIDNTTTDAYGVLFGGDVTGVAAGIADFQVVPKHLILDAGYGSVTKATMQNYNERGMTSGKHDFSNIELGDVDYYGSRLTASFFDRRFEFYGAYYQGSSQLKNIRDQDGNIIAPAQNAQVQRGHVTIIGTRFDLTDDYQDPRRGLRFDISRSLTPPKDLGPDFYEQNYNTTAYLPLGTRSTWAFNYFRSDAHVDRQGLTDPALVAGEQGLNCGSIADPTKRQNCQDFVDNFVKTTVANNTYGSSSSLGGFGRLRSYPTARFKGAHTIFYGSEIRWNLTDESTPYDLVFMKDVRTAWQVAFFYEIGTVADIRSELGDIWRSSGGFGFRMVGASGVVLRADFAAGREGILPSVFIGYPWEL